MLNSILLQTQSSGGSGMSNILMIIALIVIFYFFLIRPQSKKQKEIKKFREGMQKGDRVTTAGGIYGKIRDIKDTVILLEISEGVKITIDKNCVYPSVSDAIESGNDIKNQQ